MSEKLPPHNLEAEQIVIGGLLFNSNAIVKVIDIVKPESFFKQAHKIIYTAIIEKFNNNEPVDVISVSETIKDNKQLDQIGGRAYINDLALNIVTTANIDYYANKVADNYKLRQIIKASTEVIDLAYDKVNPELIINEADNKFFNIGTYGTTEGLLPVISFTSEVFGMIEANYENKGEVSGIPSGFYDLDKMTGGFQKSDLIIIAGRPSMGKTAIICNIADNVGVKHQTPVAIISLEMSKEQLLLRMFLSDAGINSSRYMNGDLGVQDWHKLTEAMQTIGESPIYIDDNGGQTVSQIKAKCRKLKKEKPDLGLIIIDYLQLIESEKEGKDRTADMTKITRALKNIAKELKVPVIALSQLSRACESRQDKRPFLSDLRESGSIEQDADVVIMLYRDDYYYPDSKDKGKAELIIAKQRNGPTGVIKLGFQSELTKFFNLVKNSFTK